MPIAVRTNVAFDSHSSRLVRKKAARTEAGVVVLESPAIVQERLAPHGSRATRSIARVRIARDLSAGLHVKSKVTHVT